MLALIVVLTLVSPAGEPSCDPDGYPLRAECRVTCAWWSRAELRCRDVDVENLGEWDPRPPPSEWPR